VIKSGLSIRSRRRRSTFALFGRHVQRIAVEPMPDRVWPPHEGASEAVARRGMPADGERQQADLLEVVARVQREALADRRLQGAVEPAELDRLIDETVRALWATSRVKSFVPLFAMQRVREQLGLADEPPGSRS
jgi:hypothetical protein